MARTYTIPKPPGGSLTCGDNQMGIVDVINGEVHASCTAVPSSRTQSHKPSGTMTRRLSQILAGNQQVSMSSLSSGRIVQENPHKVERLRNLHVDPSAEVITYFFLPERYRRNF